jgi:hypothetical protein
MWSVNFPNKKGHEETQGLSFVGLTGKNSNQIVSDLKLLHRLAIFSEPIKNRS